MLRHCSSSISYLWDLPEDVKVGILSRLPESDLITSKLVCKEWNFLISSICIPMLSPPNPATPFWKFLCFEDPPPPLEPGQRDPSPDPNPNGHKYLRLELLVRREPYHYFKQFLDKITSGNPTIRDHIMSLLPMMDHDPSHIIDCCNGLLLLAADSQSYFVGNPVTRQQIAIPVSNTHTHEHPESINASLVFDPSVSLHFKVVRYTRSAVDATPSNPLSLDIFSSDTGEWSSRILPLEPNNMYGFKWIKKSVYFNGSLYYMSMAMYLVCIDNVLDGDQRLKAWAVELPDKVKIKIGRNEDLHGCIGYSSGCFYYSNRDTKGAIFVWMLIGKGKNSEWVLKHSIRIDHDIVPTGLFVRMMNRCKELGSFRPRAFHPNDDVIIMACPRVLVFYHLKTKYVELGHFPFRYRRKTILMDQNWIFPYAQSLVSLNTLLWNRQLDL
ncbi:hypothetical protein OROGR_002204 [Orobanche gracilis]